VEVQTPPNEPEPTTDAVEAVTDASVEIAQIEADASVAIAETHAAVEIARIEADTEARQDDTEWRARLTSMEAENNSLREQVSTLQTQLLEQTALTAIVAETTSEEPLSATDPQTLEAETIISTPQSTSAETSETQTGPIAVSDNAKEVAVSVPLVAVRKPIFKLV
jgi:hypothetical protein